MTLKVVVFSVLVLTFAPYTEQECRYNVTDKNTEKFMPVPVSNDSFHYELVIPYKGLISLKERQKLTLVCPGVGNYLTLTNSNGTSVSCKEESKIDLFGREVSFQDLQCKKIVKGQLRITSQRCGNKRGFIYDIGYWVTRKDWITLISVCYQAEIGNTLYTEHVIHGKYIEGASKAKYRPSFSTLGLDPNVSATVAYNKFFQKATFNQLLKSALLAEKYINNTFYLARGHMSPDADFLLATAQYSTYFYINTAPQWQTINAGNWKSVENAIRKIATSFETLTVLTGTHGILNYPNKDQARQDIYLISGTKIPVPKFVWKIAYANDTREVIVFVILNDPFRSQLYEEDVFCQDICAENGYRSTSWKRFSKGYVYCCDYGQFKKVVKSVPSLKVSGVLYSR